MYLNSTYFAERIMAMKSILIRDTTKEERIALIREWLPDDDGLEADGAWICGTFMPIILMERRR